MMRTPIPRARLGAPLLLLLFLATAACTSGNAGGNGVATLNDPSASAASPSPSLSPDEAILAFTRCMREHGVDMPDPKVAGGGDGKGGGLTFQVGGGGTAAEKKKFQEADAACRHFMEAAGGGFSGKGIDPADQDALIAYSRCMREHGIDMPDPVFGDNGSVTIGRDDDVKGDVDPNSSKFREANEACKSLLPGGGNNFQSGTEGGGPSGPGSSPSTNQQPATGTNP